MVRQPPSKGARTKKFLTFEEKILKLEELASELLEAARQLPSSTERHNILKEIGFFRVRIAALRESGN